MDGLLDNQIVQIILLIIGLGIVWTIVRFVLRLAAKVFFLGCSLIIAFAIVVWILQSGMLS